MAKRAIFYLDKAGTNLGNGAGPWNVLSPLRNFLEFLSRALQRDWQCLLSVWKLTRQPNLLPVGFPAPWRPHSPALRVFFGIQMFVQTNWIRVIYWERVFPGNKSAVL